jgi:hypothetical protein
VIGRDVAMLVPDEFRARHQQGFTVAMSGRARGPASAPFHLPVVCADGVERVFAARFTVLDDPHGTPCGALVLLSHARSDAEPWTPVEP